MNDNETAITTKNQGFLTYPQDGWRKAMFKWPVQLWRLGLAPILGQFMMLITQTGRKSGQPRRTMTESYRIGDKYYAPCAFGERAQWYKNIAADPRVTIQTAHSSQSSIAVRVSNSDEILAVMAAVEDRSSAIHDMYLDYLDIRPDPEDIIAKKDRIYWFRFDPTDETTPPPLEADLAWVLPAALLVFLVVIVLGFLKKRS
jgi:deazaflavin-dependent oxidoreductase (nitroreductase family)